MKVGSVSSSTHSNDAMPFKTITVHVMAERSADVACQIIGHRVREAWKDVSLQKASRAAHVAKLQIKFLKDEAGEGKNGGEGGGGGLHAAQPCPEVQRELRNESNWGDNVFGASFVIRASPEIEFGSSPEGSDSLKRLERELRAEGLSIDIQEAKWHIPETSPFTYSKYDRSGFGAVIPFIARFSNTSLRL